MLMNVLTIGIIDNDSFLIKYDGEWFSYSTFEDTGYCFKEYSEEIFSRYNLIPINKVGNRTMMLVNIKNRSKPAIETLKEVIKSKASYIESQDIKIIIKDFSNIENKNFIISTGMNLYLNKRLNGDDKSMVAKVGNNLLKELIDCKKTHDVYVL